MIDSNQYRLVMPFLSDDPQFARGFECGKLYRQMLDGKPLIRDPGTYHQANMDQIQIMTGHCGYTVENVEVLDGGTWFHATFVKKG